MCQNPPVGCPFLTKPAISWGEMGGLGGLLSTRTWSSVRLAQIQCQTPPLQQLQHPPIFMARKPVIKWEPFGVYQTWSKCRVTLRDFPKVIVNCLGLESNDLWAAGWERKDNPFWRVKLKRNFYNSYFLLFLAIVIFDMTIFVNQTGCHQKVFFSVLRANAGVIFGLCVMMNK